MTEFALGFVCGAWTFYAVAYLVRARARREEARLQSAWGPLHVGEIERRALVTVLVLAERLPATLLTTPINELKEQLLVLEGACEAARMVIAP